MYSRFPLYLFHFLFPCTHPTPSTATRSSAVKLKKLFAKGCVFITRLLELLQYYCQHKKKQAVKVRSFSNSVRWQVPRKALGLRRARHADAFMHAHAPACICGGTHAYSWRRLLRVLPCLEQPVCGDGAKRLSVWVLREEVASCGRLLFFSMVASGEGAPSRGGRAMSDMELPKLISRRAADVRCIHLTCLCSCRSTDRGANCRVQGGFLPVRQGIAVF